MEKYDLLVIGSGPAGQRAAIQGAKSGKRVALVEMREVVGGCCVNTGTIPSKTMREAVLHLSGYQYQNIYGVNYRVKDKIFCGTGQTTRPRITFKAVSGVQEALVGSDPERFFIPQYTGPKGWVGIRLNNNPDWPLVQSLIEDSYRLTAPKRLVHSHDSSRR